METSLDTLFLSAHILGKAAELKIMVVFHGTSERKAANVFIRSTLSLSTLVLFIHLLSHTNTFNGPLPCAKCSLHGTNLAMKTNSKL